VMPVGAFALLRTGWNRVSVDVRRLAGMLGVPGVENDSDTRFLSDFPLGEARLRFGRPWFVHLTAGFWFLFMWPDTTASPACRLGG
jgi:hypothetical protein